MNGSKMSKITVYVPIEVKQYLKNRRVSMSQWCRKAIEKKMKYFKKIVYLYNTDEKFRQHRKFIKYKSREKQRKLGLKVS
jgi:hypothetical protein